MSSQLNYLDFEQPIVELEEKISELRRVGNSSAVEIHEEIQKLEEKSRSLTKSIFSSLTDWQVVSIARHPKRPQTLDYIPHIFDDFIELHGDREHGDDSSIIGGMARLGDQTVMLIGHQKGHTTKEKIHHNFGMPKPEGYRKALRLMRLAEQFRLPILTFIDTPGAYPGIDAERNNQSGAIALNLREASTLKIPIICTVIGEGGSGGALAIGVGDTTLMLQYSIYSVISPEGCASILWKSASKAPEATRALALTAQKLHQQGIIDQIIQEPPGGAHRDIFQAAESLKNALVENLQKISLASTEELLEKRYRKLMAFGEFKND